MVYLVQYPIPAPFNVLALLFDLPLVIGRWVRKTRAGSKKPAAARGGRSRPAPPALDDDNSSTGTVTPSLSASTRASRAPDWLDPAVKEQMNTRQYLMERAAHRIRPFQYDKTIVFTRGEASAIEKAARERYLQQRRALEDRRREELLHSHAFIMLQRRLDALDSKLWAQGSQGSTPHPVAANGSAPVHRSVAPSTMPASSQEYEEPRKGASSGSSAQSPGLIPVPRPLKDASLRPKRLKLEREQPKSDRHALPPLRAAPDGKAELKLSSPAQEDLPRYVMRSMLEREREAQS